MTSFAISGSKYEKSKNLEENPESVSLCSMLPKMMLIRNVCLWTLETIMTTGSQYWAKRTYFRDLTNSKQVAVGVNANLTLYDLAKFKDIG